MYLPMISYQYIVAHRSPSLPVSGRVRFHVPSTDSRPVRKIRVCVSKFIRHEGKLLASVVHDARRMKPGITIGAGSDRDSWITCSAWTELARQTAP